MQLAGRAQAACEILSEIFERHRPAAIALQDWAKAHRFAGSGDRAAIGNLVYDALRQRSSLAWQMQDESPLALIAAALRLLWGFDADAVEQLFDGSAHAPPRLTAAQADGLRTAAPETAPDHVKGNYPEWLDASLKRNFGNRAAAEGEALAQRAPVDLRVNTLKATRPKVLQALLKHGATPTAMSPIGIRIPARDGAKRSPQVEAEPGHAKGWFEVQDEGSQLAAHLCGAGPRLQLADLCAGAGGKTLAFAAMMQNTGQIHAFDTDAQRLRPIFERLKRAGARNVQVLPAGETASLEKLHGAMDRVFIDAPCTGSGVWRRRPDAKWRLSPDNLAQRRGQQRILLPQGAALVKPGGSLVYVTCSMLPEENQDQIASFLGEHRGFVLQPYQQIWREVLPGDPPNSALDAGGALQLTPACHGTDGFFIAVMQRRGAD